MPYALVVGTISVVLWLAESVGERISWTGKGNSVILPRLPLRFGNGTKEKNTRLPGSAA